MGKYYAQWRRPKVKERPWKIHPIWRGIGCLMAVLIPLVAFVLADYGVDANLQQRWVPVPTELVGPTGFPFLYAKITLAAILTIIIFGGYTLIYMIIYSMLGPSRYGPLDVPPLRRKRRKRLTRRR